MLVEVVSHCIGELNVFAFFVQFGVADADALQPFVLHVVPCDVGGIGVEHGGGGEQRRQQQGEHQHIQYAL